MTRLLARLRAFYATQLYLWERHGQRHNSSGLDARAVMRAPRLEPLRWTGDKLGGDVLPPLDRPSF